MSSKIDWATMSVDQVSVRPVWFVRGRAVPDVSPGWGPTTYSNLQRTGGLPITINGTTYPVVTAELDAMTILGLWSGSDGVDDKGTIVRMEIGLVTWAAIAQQNLRGKLVIRYRHGNYNSGDDGKNWVTVN